MKFVSPLLALALAGCSVVGIRGGTEEPAYKVVATYGRVQIRDYVPRLAASVAVPGDEIAARSAGFIRLARFIFGGNTGGVAIDMTAPVAQSSAKIAMTAPVAQTRNAAGLWEITFFMPAKYTAATLPKPNDPGIGITEIPAQVFAVYRYTGVPSPAPVARAHVALLQNLAGSGWAPAASPIDWLYDPPWTIPFLRRNEAAVLVVRK